MPLLSPNVKCKFATVCIAKRVRLHAAQVVTDNFKYLHEKCKLAHKKFFAFATFVFKVETKKKTPASKAQIFENLNIDV